MPFFERSHGQINRIFLALQSLVLVVAVLFLWRPGSGNEEQRPERAANSHRVVGDNVKSWSILMTVQGGGGNEALRFGWYSVQVDSDGNSTARKHPGLQGSIDVLDEKAIANSKGSVIFHDAITADQRTAVFQAAAAAINNFELQPTRGTRSEDGWRITLKMTSARREVSVGARELGSIADAGNDIQQLIKSVNTYLPGKGLPVE
jgi:hypothetical protein